MLAPCVSDKQIYDIKILASCRNYQSQNIKLKPEKVHELDSGSMKHNIRRICNSSKQDCIHCKIGEGVQQEVCIKSIGHYKRIRDIEGKKSY